MEYITINIRRPYFACFLHGMIAFLGGKASYLNPCTHKAYRISWQAGWHYGEEMTQDEIVSHLIHTLQNREEYNKAVMCVHLPHEIAEAFAEILEIRNRFETNKNMKPRERVNIETTQRLPEDLPVIRNKEKVHV